MTDLSGHTDETLVTTGRDIVRMANNVFLEMARRNIEVTINTTGNSYIGSGMGGEAVLLQAEFKKVL